jgi:hypothetical protein
MTNLSDFDRHLNNDVRFNRILDQLSYSDRDWLSMQMRGRSITPTVEDTILAEIGQPDDVDAWSNWLIIPLFTVGFILSVLLTALVTLLIVRGILYQLTRIEQLWNTLPT